MWCDYYLVAFLAVPKKTQPYLSRLKRLFLLLVTKIPGRVLVHATTARKNPLPISWSKSNQSKQCVLTAWKTYFFNLLLKCQCSRFLPLLSCREYQWWQSGRHRWLPSKHLALQSWHLNCDQAGRKDCQPESAADSGSAAEIRFHLSLSLSFPCPGLLVVLPPQRQDIFPFHQ